MTTTPDVTIRAEGLADHYEISRVVAAAFGADVEADLVELIRDSPEYVPEMALVAEAGGEIVGHVMVSGTALRHGGEHGGGERTIVMLAPLAVRPDRQKTGLGAALVAAVVAIADERGEPLVVLEGSPDYYGRLGFEPAARYGIEMPLPDWAPPEAAQVMRLSTYDPADSTLRGTVVYPAAFDGVE